MYYSFICKTMFCHNIQCNVTHHYDMFFYLSESSSSAVLDSIEQQNDSLVMVPQTMDELLHGSPNLKFEVEIK